MCQEGSVLVVMGFPSWSTIL